MDEILDALGAGELDVAGANAAARRLTGAPAADSRDGLAAVGAPRPGVIPSTVALPPGAIERPDVKGAEQSLYEAQVQRYEAEGISSGDARLKAQADAPRAPSPRPTAPSVLAAIRRAFALQTYQPETGAPVEASTTPGQEVGAALRTLDPTQGIRAIPRVAGAVKAGLEAIPSGQGTATFLRGAFPADSLTVRPGEEPFLVEDPQRRLVRVLGGTLSSLAQEATVGAALPLAGVTPADRKLTYDTTGKDPLSAWLIRAAEKVEKGHGFAEDLEAAAAKHFGDTDEVRTWGWRVGLLGDILVPWEAPAFKVVGKVGQAQRFAGEVGKIATEGSDASRGAALAASIAGREVDYAQMMVDEVAVAMAEGTFHAEKLAPDVRAMADSWSRDLHGVSFEDLLAGKKAVAEPGVGATKAEPLVLRPDPSNAAARTPYVMPPEIRPTNEMELWAMLTGLTGSDAPRLAPSQGFNALRWLDPEQTVASPEYVIRRGVDRPGPGGRGRVIAPDLDAAIVGEKASLDEALAVLRKRRNPDEHVFFKDQRRVAGWRKRDSADGTRRQFALTPHYHFTSPDEISVIERIAGEAGGFDEAAQVVRDVHRAPIPLLPQQGWSGVLSAMLGGRAAERPGLSLAGAQGEALGILERVFTGQALAAVGHSKLVPLTADVWVPRDEAGRIVAKLHEVSARVLGRQLDKAHTAPPELVAKLAREYGVTPPEKITRQFYNELIDGIVEREARVALDFRHALRATRPFSERLLLGVLDAAKATPGKILNEGGKAAQVARALIAVDRAALHPGVRGHLDTLFRELAGNGEDLLREVRRFAASKPFVSRVAKGIDVSPFLRDMARTLRPITDGEIRIADEVDRLSRVGSAAALAVDKLLALARRESRNFDDLYPDAIKYADNPLITHAALRRWAADKRADVKRLALQWVRANSPRRSWSEVSPIAEKWDADRVLSIYREAFIDGARGSQELDRALTEIGMGGAPRETVSDALVRFVLQVRAEDKMAGLVERLIDDGIGIAAADVGFKRVVQDVLFGNDAVTRTVDGAAVQYKLYDEATTSRALTLIRRWGLERGTGVALVRVEGGVFLPAPIAREVARLQAIGIDTSRVFAGDNPVSRVLDKTYSWFKAGVTFGLFIPSAAYHASNVIGSVFNMALTLGPSSTATALFRNLRRPDVTARLVARLSRWEFQFPDLLDAKTGQIVTPTGKAYDLDELHEAIRKYGIDSAQAKLETAESIGNELRRYERGWTGGASQPGARSKLLAPGRAAVDVVTAWQEVIGDVATVVEQQFRIGVFINQLERGSSIEEAARLARESLFDYGTLTAFERGVMRKIVPFYAYMRKSSDAMWKAVFDHPERVLAQLRLFRDQRQWWGQDEAQLFTMERDELTRLVVADMAPGPLGEVFRPDGSLDWRYRGLFALTTPVGLTETLFLQTDLLEGVAWWGAAGLSAERGGVARRRLISQTNPVVALVGNLIYGVNVGTGAGTDSDRANEIPPFMMRPPFSWLSTTAFAPEPRRLAADDDPALATTTIGGEPARWVATNVPTFQAWKQTTRRWSMESPSRALKGIAAARAETDDLQPWSTPAAAMLEAAGFRIEPQLTGQMAIEDRLRSAQQGMERRAAKIRGTVQ